MSTDTTGEALCHEVDEALADVLDGTATARLYDHIAACDRCRDARHDAERAGAVAAAAGADFRAPDGFAERLVARLDAAPQGGAAPTIEAMPVIAVTRAEAPADGMATAPTELAVRRGDDEARTERAAAAIDAPRAIGASPTIGAGAPAVTGRAHDSAKGAREALAAPPPDGLSSNDTRKPAQGGVVRLLRRPVFVAGLAGAMAAAAAAGLYLRGGDATGSLVSGPASGSWTGKVTAIARASADKTGGLEICDEAGACAPASDGAEVPAGARLRTDARTRARIALSDGSEIALDRASEASFEAGDVRVVRLAAGSIVADVATADGRPPARLVFDQGELRTDGAKLALATTTQRASVEIARGAATLQSDTGKPVTLRAGEESTVSRGSEPTIASATSLADRMEWSDASRDEAEPVLRGLGELRAKRPGSTTEKDRAVRLSKHAVKIRIVDLVARTEVDETFTNDTDEELEGIFRFPLPPGAQIEGLSLEVDGQLMAGAFVDRDKGAAIWRGVIQNAAPKAPRPREEIFWVPGPWRDPALLEWQRGGRFELKIFPIPKRGSRRVVLSYTQAIEPSAGVRRFTYPLAHDEAGTTKVESFDVDLQVLGHDKAFGVQTLGYEMGEVAGGDSAAERRSMHASGFVPSGDLSVEYALPDRDRGATAWAYRMDSTFASPAGATARRGDDRAAGEVADAIANDASPYVAIAIRPKLPRWQEAKERLHVLVVDTSRSMFGERYARATRLASSIVREMDRRDSFLVLACDAQCEPMLAPDALGAGRADEAGSRSSRRLATPMAPGAASAGEVERFLGGIEPDGASDLAAAIGAARAAAGGRSAKELRVIYLGDGTPTVGPTRASHLEAAVRTAMPAGDGSVIAVALGADSDTASLQAIARGGGGVVIPYAPGQKLASAALDVLGAAYGEVLRDPVVELPAGLTQATPSRLDSIRAGGEALVFARMSSGSEVDGVVRLTGRVGGERFEKSYPLRIVATSSAGNAFVPRLFAAAKIEELDRAGGDLAKRTSIELSKRFAVASRFTSLLVLESEAMFDAFGLTQSTAAPVFTGEQLALSESSEAEAAAEASPDADASGFASPPSAIGGGGSRSLDDAFEGAFGSGAPAKSRPSTASPAPAATMAPPPRPEAKRAGPADRAPARSPWEEDAPRRRMVPMRKVFDRKASFDATNTVALQNVSKLEAAERELRAAPDSRDKTVSMYALYATSGRLGEAQDLTSRWSGRDALDPEALIARADLAARQGDRPRAMRILGGLADVRPGDKAPLRRLVELHDAAGNGAAACAHRVALADLTPSDASLLADAMRCSQSMGQSDLAAAMRDDADPKVRSALEPLLVAASTTKATALGGDVRLAAEWTGADDLDFALVDAQGRRISWMGSPTKVAVTSRDATSLRTESVAFAGLLSGTYVLEVSRAADRPGAEVARGEVTLTLAGETRRVPFTLAGARTELGTVRVFFTSRLVPVNEPSGWWNRR